LVLNTPKTERKKKQIIQRKNNMSTIRSRGVGVSAFQNRESLTNSYATRGAALRSSNSDSLSTQISVFQSLLHSFAIEHGEAIKNDPGFRAEFARMCNAIGVDPRAGSNLAGKKSSRSWWNSIMREKGDDFYVRVALRIVEECQATRGENGGLLSVQECRERVVKGQDIGGGIQVTE
jgi:ESCRT-II complex subunit VPS22